LRWSVLCPNKHGRSLHLHNLKWWTPQFKWTILRKRRRSPLLSSRLLSHNHMLCNIAKLQAISMTDLRNCKYNKF
jgi:hypothetical protein